MAPIKEDQHGGPGWDMRKDGTIFTGTRIPDARWMRRKRIEFIGNAEYGDGGSPLRPLAKLIADAKEEGDVELAEKLEDALKIAERNLRDAGKDRAQEKAEAEQGEKAMQAMMTSQAAVAMANFNASTAAGAQAPVGNPAPAQAPVPVPQPTRQ